MQRIAEGCGECQVTKRRREHKRRDGDGEMRKKRVDEILRWSKRNEKEEREEAQRKEAQRIAKECRERQEALKREKEKRC